MVAVVVKGAAVVVVKLKANSETSFSLAQILQEFYLYTNFTTNFYSKTNEMQQILKFILFFSSTLHVSDSLSVHHQESKAVHTALGICQTDSADCSSIPFLLASSQQNLFDIYLMLYVQS